MIFATVFCFCLFDLFLAIGLGKRFKSRRITEEEVAWAAEEPLEVVSCDGLKCVICGPRLKCRYSLLCDCETKIPNGNFMVNFTVKDLPGEIIAVFNAEGKVQSSWDKSTGIRFLPDTNSEFLERAFRSVDRTLGTGFAS